MTDIDQAPGAGEAGIVTVCSDALQVREMPVRSLMADVTKKSAKIVFKQATIDQLTYEMAVLKRLKFAAKSESFNAEQRSLLEETIEADLEALARELEQQRPTPARGVRQAGQ